MKYLAEVFLTKEYVEENVWSRFLYTVSKLNGFLKKWKMYIYIEDNTVRYLIETNKKLPSIISDFSEFILKIVEDEEFEQKRIFPGRPYFILNKEKSVLDIYDKNEVKRNKKVKIIEINILPITKKLYKFSTKIYFEC